MVRLPINFSMTGCKVFRGFSPSLRGKASGAWPTQIRLSSVSDLPPLGLLQNEIHDSSAIAYTTTF